MDVPSGAEKTQLAGQVRAGAEGRAGSQDADDDGPAWHAPTPAQAAARAAVDPAHGLSAAEVGRRCAVHGANRLPEPPLRTRWQVLLRQIRSPLIHLLFVAAALALALGEHGDAAAASLAWFGWLLAGLAASVLLQALVLYAPPLHALFHTVPLPPATLLALLVLASSVLWVEELRKMRARSLPR